MKNQSGRFAIFGTGLLAVLVTVVVA